MESINKNKNISGNVKSLNKDIDRLFIAQRIFQSIAQKNTLKDICITLLNKIESEMGYSAASISFVYFEDKEIQLKYLSDSLVSRLSKLLILTKPNFNRMALDGGTLTQQAAMTNKIIIDDDLSNFISPPLSKNKAVLIQRLANIKSMIAVPIRTKSTVIGVLNFSFNKPKIQILSNEIRTLEQFTDQVGLIIDNAVQYEQIEAFNTKLEQEIDKAVSDLKSQNANLISLYELARDTSKSLDIKEVMQIAVDTIPQNEMITGATIGMLDHGELHIKVEAITDNPVSRAVSKKTGKITDISYDVKANTNTYKVLKEGQPIFNDDLIENFDGILPPKLISVVQKLSKISSVAEYPILSREKVIGTITYFLKNVKADELTDEFKQLLMTYSLQISTAMQNAIQYQESQVMQRNLQRALNGLHEARRRETDMVDVMGHELRTPLAIVRNALVILDKDFKQDGIIQSEKLGKYLAMAIESARREMTLVETLLAATKLEGHRIQLLLTECDIIDVVEDSLEALGRAGTQKGLKLIFDKPDESLSVYADRTRIQEVMDNLLSNAIKYTREGSITISIIKQKDFIGVNVKDTGVGISKEDITKLGKKFFRASQMLRTHVNGVHPGGTGLGLYVSFGLVKIMNGTYKIDSEPGKGSSFSFLFPIYTNQKDSHIDQTLGD